MCKTLHPMSLNQFSRPIPSLQLLRIDSDDEGECGEHLFPGESEVTDAAIVLLRKKMSGKYTLFKVC